MPQGQAASPPLASPRPRRPMWPEVMRLLSRMCRSPAEARLEGTSAAPRSTSGPPVPGHFRPRRILSALQCKLENAKSLGAQVNSLGGPRRARTDDRRIKRADARPLELPIPLPHNASSDHSRSRRGTNCHVYPANIRPWAELPACACGSRRLACGVPRRRSGCPMPRGCVVARIPAPVLGSAGDLHDEPWFLG